MYNEVNAMVCKSCGRDNINENANFCEYCGEDIRESNIHNTQPTYDYSNQSGTGGTSATPPHPTQAIEINKNEKPVSFLNWLGTYAIMLIPFVGGIVFFIMLIIWSVSNNIPESKKNWARANLVFMIIMLVIVLIFVFMVLSMLKNPIFQEIFQDSFNSEMERYNDLFRDYSY